MRIAVGVLTYRRNQDLRELLPQLSQQAQDHDADVLVIDNDPARGAQEVVELSRRELSLGNKLIYVHEPQPGIAAARNAALRATKSYDVLVFIDDDERPVDLWLTALIRTFQEHPGPGVVGAVRSSFEHALEPWVQAGDFFRRRHLPTGSKTRVAATNNLLLDLSVVRELGLDFEDAFGLSGGSDTLFTRRLTAAAGPLVWCQEALVIDRVPPARATRRWVLRRAFRTGNHHVRVERALASGPAGRVAVLARIAPGAVLRLLVGTAQAVLGRLRGSVRAEARGARTAARGAGMLAGIFGRVFVEYARTDEVRPTPTGRP